MKLKFLLLTCFALLVGIVTKANTDPGNGTESPKKADLLGAVVHNDSKRPVNCVTVTAKHLTTKKEQMVLTDANGNYSFTDLQPGTYKFVFAKDGYKKVTREKIAIRQDEGVLINVELAEEAINFMPGPFHFSEFD